MGLLTGNYRGGARLKLEYYRLYQHFSFGGYGDHHHDRNDVAREALHEVRRQLNGTVDAKRVWVIGDTPADIRCARSIGANVLAVATGVFAREELEAEDPDILQPDFSDPEPLLRVLSGDSF